MPYCLWWILCHLYFWEIFSLDREFCISKFFFAFRLYKFHTTIIWPLLKSTVILYSSVYTVSFFFWLFNDFSLYHWFSIIWFCCILVWFSVYFFCLRICLAYWIWIYSFQEMGEMVTIISSNKFSLFLPLFSPSETPVTLISGHCSFPQLTVGLFVSFISVILLSVFHFGEFLLLCLHIC